MSEGSTRPRGSKVARRERRMPESNGPGREKIARHAAHIGKEQAAPWPGSGAVLERAVLLQHALPRGLGLHLLLRLLEPLLLRRDLLHSPLCPLLLALLRARDARQADEEAQGRRPQREATSARRGLGRVRRGPLGRPSEGALLGRLGHHARGRRQEGRARRAQERRDAGDGEQTAAHRGGARGRCRGEACGATRTTSSRATP
mmetsp:Transcript_45912/g.121815  ORF Transcript_45912/g.121815 Transcript_45912/m.121815 type:complete len:203 (-) Transcript_45912:7-615(-)